MSAMRERRVVLAAEADRDMERVEAYVAEIYRPEAGQRYVRRLYSYISELSIAAKSFPLSRYLVARRIHPEARTMAVMHRWTIIFHIYGDYVIVDRIIASKMMTE